MKLRSIVLSDYSNLISFWKKNYFVRGIDNLDRFKLFLEKNPDLSIVAEVEGKIAGTVLGSFDGRRGYLQKLVVRKDLRGKGVGKGLIQEAVRRLKALGVVYIPISCEKENRGFYKKLGFKNNKQVIMSLEVS
ncbi:GNAT family N-acetyltransferase [Candidatus Microgenomates bacterium]|nr:GNAT family N-acetyltransferase [Candidatus Microgenomates bacterium]